MYSLGPTHPNSTHPTVRPSSERWVAQTAPHPLLLREPLPLHGPGALLLYQVSRLAPFAPALPCHLKKN